MPTLSRRGGWLPLLVLPLALSARADETTATAPTDDAVAAKYAPLLSLDQARHYMLDLINRDRATQNLPPLTLDEGAAQTAGQRHAEDMAVHGFLRHWGTDGSPPEQRYTESGGTDYDQENAECSRNGLDHELVSAPTFKPSDIAHIESQYFNELPPHDGHRKAILGQWHRRVGIGIAQPKSIKTGHTTHNYPACTSQEFINPYGTYAPIPKSLHVGDTLTITGQLETPAQIAEISLARMDLPQPLDLAGLDAKGGGYESPRAYVSYWPRPYVSAVPIEIKGDRFSIVVPVSDDGQPGLYEVNIWVKMPGHDHKVLVSQRTVPVR